VAGREQTVQVPAVRHDPRLVQRGPHRHAVPQRPEHHTRIVGEPVGDVAVEPSAAVVECGRQVPVIQRDVRRDPGGQQPVNEPAVEVETTLVHGAGPVRQHAAPRDAEPVRVEAELAHERDVTLPAPVVIARRVTGLAVRRQARRMRETLPDARASAIRQRRALDLVRRRRGAPEKRIGKTYGVMHGCPRAVFRMRSADPRP
jgi:hypothetical protein